MASCQERCYHVAVGQQENQVSEVNSNGLKIIDSEEGPTHTFDEIIAEPQGTDTDIESISTERGNTKPQGMDTDIECISKERGDTKRHKNKYAYLSSRRPNQDNGFDRFATSRRNNGIQERRENREETITVQPMPVSSLDDGGINRNMEIRTTFIYTLPQNVSVKTLIVKRVMSILLAMAELSIDWFILYNIQLPPRELDSNRVRVIKLLFWISNAITTLFAFMQIANSIGETIFEATKGKHGFRILHGWKEVALSIIFGDLPQYILMFCAIVVDKGVCQDKPIGFEIAIAVSGISIINKIVRWVTCLQDPENRYCCSCWECLECWCQLREEQSRDDNMVCRDCCYCLCCCEFDDDNNFYCCCIMRNDENVHMKVRNDCCLCRNEHCMKPVLKDPQYTLGALLFFFTLFFTAIIFFIIFSIRMCTSVYIPLTNNTLTS